MTGLFAGGIVIEAILAGMVLEGVGLAAYHRMTGRGVATDVFLPNLISGMFLLLAMRLLIGGASWGWESACLLGALVCHVFDLSRLWRS